MTALMKKDIEMIIIEAFGETFLDLVLRGEISTKQFRLLVEESQKRVEKGLNDEVKRRALELEHLKAQLKPYEQKN